MKALPLILPTMNPTVRKLMLTAHVVASVGWLGAVSAFFALNIAGLLSQDARVAGAADFSMALVARFVILPLALASLVTGIVQSLGTTWGLFRQYWIITKLFLTVLATAILLVKMEKVGRVAAAAWTGYDLRQEKIELAIHAGGGIAILLFATILSLFKPWGATSRGTPERKHPAANAHVSVKRAALTSAQELPRPLKILLFALTVGAAAFVLLHVMGNGFSHHNH